MESFSPVIYNSIITEYQPNPKFNINLIVWGKISKKKQKNKYNKVSLGWNMAFSDWKIHGKNRLIRGLNIILPSKKNALISILSH